MINGYEQALKHYEELVKQGGMQLTSLQHQQLPTYPQSSPQPQQPQQTKSQKNVQSSVNINRNQPK